MEIDIIKNFNYLNLNILKICKKINRNPLEINIVAVSKGQDQEKLKGLLKIKHNSFGENRLQEATHKWNNFKNEYVDLHYIGALQSKKAQGIYEIFDVIETLDSDSSAEKIAKCIIGKVKQ